MTYAQNLNSCFIYGCYHDEKRNFAGYFIGTWPMTFVHFPNYALIRITLVLHIFCIWIITSYNNDMSVTMQSLSLLEKRPEC